MSIDHTVEHRRGASEGGPAATGPGAGLHPVTAEGAGGPAGAPRTDHGAAAPDQLPAARRP